MIGKHPIIIYKTGIIFTTDKYNHAYENIGKGKVRMLNYADRYIIFQTRTDIKVYDTTTNLLKSPYVSNQRIKNYIKESEVDGSCCVAGMSIYCYVNPGSYGDFNRLVRINAQKLV